MELVKEEAWTVDQVYQSFIDEYLPLQIEGGFIDKEPTLDQVKKTFSNFVEGLWGNGDIYDSRQGAENDRNIEWSSEELDKLAYRQELDWFKAYYYNHTN